MLAVSNAEGSLGRGTKCKDSENQSTIVKITVWQLDGGKPVTKSTAIWDNGRLGMGNGCNNPAGG